MCLHTAQCRQNLEKHGTFTTAMDGTIAFFDRYLK